MIPPTPPLQVDEDPKLKDRLQEAFSSFGPVVKIYLPSDRTSAELKVPHASASASSENFYLLKTYSFGC
jgi:hypothetical protein